MPLASPDQPREAPDNLDSGSRLRLGEVERDWAARRLEAYRNIDATIQQAIGDLLRAVADTRQQVEQEAQAVLAGLEAERAQLAEKIDEQRRQRDELAAELADVRRRAEGEADAIRRQAATEARALLGEAERRRSDLLGEIQRLERQLAQVSRGIQSLLQGHIGRARPSSEAKDELTAEPETAPRLAAADPPVVQSVTGRDVTVRGTPSSRRIAEPASTLPRVESVPPSQPAAPPPPRPSLPRAVAPTSPAAGESAQPPDDGEAAQRTEVAVAGTPSFARALELQRGIQRTPGVRQVQALQFERGRLVLAVEHEPDLDLAAAVEALPNVQLALLDSSNGRLEFVFR